MDNFGNVISMKCLKLFVGTGLVMNDLMNGRPGHLLNFSDFYLGVIQGKAFIKKS